MLATASDIAELLRAISTLLWPLVLVGLVLSFRREVVSLFARLERFKIFGAEGELRKQLDELKETAETAAEAPIPSQQPPAPPASVEEIVGSGTWPSIAGTLAIDVDAITQRVIDRAERTPKTALLDLTVEIERAMRLLLARSGHISKASPSLRGLAEAVAEAVNLPEGTLDALSRFREVRNNIVHSESEGLASDEILRAIDSGLTILRVLAAIAIERNVVYHPGIDLYADADCTEKRTGVVGVILETTSPGGVIKSHRVFPTTRTHFRMGNEVAWEWNTSLRWDASWYRDPSSGEITLAFQGSMEFVGRHLDEV